MTDSEPGPPLDTIENYWAEAELLARAMLDRLDYFEALGATELPLSLVSSLWGKPEVSSRGTPVMAPAAPVVSPAFKASSRPQAASPDNSDPQEWAPADQTLSDLYQHLTLCRSCVPAVVPPYPGLGSSTPEVVVVGLHPASINTPGRVELLTNILAKGLELKPQQYYITTVVKCAMAKADEDDDPSPAMLRTCQPILFKELELLRPCIVLGLGEKVGQILSGLNFPLGLLRPKNHKIPALPNIWLLVTYSLEHLENSKELKKEAWKDLQRLKSGLNTLSGAWAKAPK